MWFAAPSRSPFLAGRERGFMSLRKAEPALPTSHYFLSVSRGDAIRTFMVRPVALWALLALALISLAWSAAATAYVALHDDLMGAIVARQAQMETAYEDRLADSSRPARRGRQPTALRPEFLRGQGARTPVAAGPDRATRRNRGRARRPGGRAQPFAAVRRGQRRQSSSLPTRSAPSRLLAHNRRPTERAERRAPMRPRPALTSSRGPPSLTRSTIRPRP